MIREKFENLTETKQEKTKEQLLEEFKISLEKYGVRNIECSFEQGKLTIEQKLGSGIRGLGYDKKAESLWLCLDQSDPATIIENQRWNANTILDLEKGLPGIAMEKIDGQKVKIRIAADHPAATLARLISKEEAVCLPGQFNNWQLDNPFKLNKETGEMENEILWDGNSTEGKIAISNTPCDWQSGQWEVKAAQKLEIELGE